MPSPFKSQFYQSDAPHTELSRLSYNGSIEAYTTIKSVARYYFLVLILGYKSYKLKQKEQKFKFSVLV